MLGYGGAPETRSMPEAVPLGSVGRRTEAAAGAGASTFASAACAACAAVGPSGNQERARDASLKHSPCAAKRARS